MAISQEALGFMQVGVAVDRGMCVPPRTPARLPVLRSLGAHGAVLPPRAFQFTHQNVVPASFSASRTAVFAAGPSAEGSGSRAVLPSGEWPQNFSILTFEDLSKHYESVIFKEEAQPSTFLADVMSKTIYTARSEQRLEEIDQYFIQFSGLPVINDKLECIGVLSKKDKAKASNGLSSTVGEVMSSPAITLSFDKTVSDAAVLMLKHKIHRIPIVNNSFQVVGIVTRTDIFSALEGKSS